MEEKVITALMVPPGDHPGIIELCCCKTFLDLAVSFGSFCSCDASVIQIAEDVGILCNREAPLCSLRGNRKIDGHILAGVFYIIGLKDGELISLPEHHLEYYMTALWEPETYTEEEVGESFWGNWINEIEHMPDDN